MMIAYCWSSGLIEFGKTIPNGALEIIRGPEKKIRETISATARHGYGRSAGKLLVPGIPEAPNQEKALDALFDFMDWLGECEKRREENHGS